MGKLTLKKYKEKQKEKNINKKNIKDFSLEILKNHGSNHDEALLYCLDNKLDDSIFDYIYSLQIKYKKEKRRKKKMLLFDIENHLLEFHDDFYDYTYRTSAPLGENLCDTDIINFLFFIKDY
tara:strand:- start:82 stop:447 length:366 start_codon:yes stop_codon:yes gene_type:complete